jgi:ketosteroid isomerase-like protein
MTRSPLQLLDETLRRRDAAFKAGDLEATMALYRDDAIEIDPSGALHRDKEQIGKQIGFVFGLGLTARLTELARTVDLGHHTAVLVLDSLFTSPPTDFRQHFLTAQTLVFDGREWKILLSSNTMLPD